MKSECGRMASEISSIETGQIVDGVDANNVRFKNLPDDVTKELLGRLTENPQITIKRWQSSLRNT